MISLTDGSNARKGSRTVRPIGSTRKFLSSLYESPLLIHLLEAGRWETAEHKLKHIFKELHAGGDVTKEHLLEVYCMCFMSYSYTVRQQGHTLEAIMGESMDRALDPPNNVESLEVWVFRMLRAIKGLRKEELASPKVVCDVQRIVQQHLHEDISLQQLSDKVHLHPKYLSWLYKQETGEGVSEYVNRLKMERAADWLKNSKKKIYEIAENLGYQNTSYFIRVFKGKFHMTPQQFRDRLTQ